MHEVQPDVTAPAEFFTDADVPRVQLLLAPEGRWVVERYPVDSVVDVDGRPGWSEVTLPVASERWLARLLVRLGPYAEVGAADGDSARRLAQAMLARYDEPVVT